MVESRLLFALKKTNQKQRTLHEITQDMVTLFRGLLSLKYPCKPVIERLINVKNEYARVQNVAATMATRSSLPSGSTETEEQMEDTDMRDDAKRPQFGNRFLLDPKKVFEHNAWDDVVWDDAQEKEAAQKVSENSSVLVKDDLQAKYEDSASQFWDDFYDIHQNRFFKDRKWLFTEFTELGASGINHKMPSATSTTEDPVRSACDKQEQITEQACEADTYPGAFANMRILEMGCGVGNTVFPILETNNDPSLFVYCCDFSSKAVDLVKENPDYNTKRCHAFVCDMTADSWPVPFPDESLDIVILIFVLSAIHPDKMKHVAQQIKKYLKPGGVVVFRDYGRFDMAQLRFKKGRCLSENFYVRGDGTRVYFFTPDEVREIFTSVGLKEELNMVDRRLQVNRGKLLKMYRVWSQAKFRKPID